MTKEELDEEAEEFTDSKKSFWRQGRTCIDSVKQAYIAGAEPREKRIADLEKENKELKTVKIPQLERKIASIRGAHSVDCKKLNARIEQVERLKKENTELKENNKSYEKIIDNSSATLMKEKLKNYKQLTKAKEHIQTLISCLIDWVQEGDKYYCYIVEAEQFLKEVSE